MRHVNNNNNDNNLAAVGNFGADIVPDVIVGAQGSEYITSNGRRVLDWTSGQVSDKQPNQIDLYVVNTKTPRRVDVILPRPLPPRSHTLDQSSKRNHRSYLVLHAVTPSLDSRQ
jgi:hypothetical protein